MEVVDVSNVSPALFITGAIFIMVIGSFMSVGILRLFQLKKRQGGIFMGLSVVSFVMLLVVVNTWFA
ncbi:hypothetical protein [Cohnella sp. WQ 127256]|uniref:hypothetical protein n=1 Tax=Cohnella sp. WQ 127256 TaxID=2938790 RepID=UPI002118EF45